MLVPLYTKLPLCQALFLVILIFYYLGKSFYINMGGGRIPVLPPS
jgi:hypothetical protein